MGIVLAIKNVVTGIAGQVCSILSNKAGCIAVIKPKGQDLPWSRMKFMFEQNPDGAGFAYAYKGKVYIVKGMMTYRSFKKAIRRTEKVVNFKDVPMLIHFRVSTGGGVNPGCCHPFPLTTNIDDMKITNMICDYAVVHNGTIDLTKYEANKLTETSDTMVFIAKYLSKLATNKSWFENKKNWELIYEMLGSKMAILSADGTIHYTEGFEECDGILYSNTTYKETRAAMNARKYRSYYYDYDYGYSSNYSSNYCYNSYSFYDDKKETKELTGITAEQASKSAKSKVWRSFMELKDKEQLYLVDCAEGGGNIDGVKYFIDADGHIYFAIAETDDEKSKLMGRYSTAMLCYVGKGVVVEPYPGGELNYVPFRDDKEFLENNLFWFDEKNEEWVEFCKSDITEDEVKYREAI